MKIIRILPVFIQIILFASCQEFISVNLCPEKKPSNIRNDANSDKMRDLMKRAANDNEQRLKEEGYRGKHLS